MVFPNRRGRETLTYFCFVLTNEFRNAIIGVLSMKMGELTASVKANLPGFKYIPIVSVPFLVPYLTKKESEYQGLYKPTCRLFTLPDAQSSDL